MSISASPVKRFPIGPVALRRKIPFSVRVAPLGLGCALLLYVLALAVVNRLDDRSPLVPSPRSLPLPEIEHALTAVRASMVELPIEGEARAVAELAGNARMVGLENRQLLSVVHELKAHYANLARRFEANLALEQQNMHQMRSELRRVQDQQHAFATQLGTLVERDHAVVPEQSEAGLGPGGRHPSRKAREVQLAPDEQLSLGSAVGNGLITNPVAAQSWVSNTGLTAEPSARFAALQIARKLDNTRREALLSKREQTFAIDVENGLLGEVSEGELVQLDPALEIRLDTASSEVINERSGRIRFFPDGSSTGGRIYLWHDKGGATITVDWSTGAVTVQVNES